jgi:hypothetical protein
LDEKIPVPGREGDPDQGHSPGHPDVQYECLPVAKKTVFEPQFYHVSVLVGAFSGCKRYGLEELGPTGGPKEER